MDAGTPSSSSFTVTSKPILPVDVPSNPNHHPVQNLPLNHPSSLHFETYYPVPYTRSVFVPMSPHDSSSIMQICPTVPRSIAPRHDLKTQVSTALGQIPSSGPSSSNSVFRVARSEYKAAPPPARQRTVQACDKCRERKTKCSGDRPCGRCTARGLICHYCSGETKHRGPSRARQQTSNSSLNSRFVDSATCDADRFAYPVPTSSRGSTSLPSSVSVSPVLKSGKLLASDIDSSTQPQTFVQAPRLDPALQLKSKFNPPLPLPTPEQSSIIHYPGCVEGSREVGNVFMPRAETTPRECNSMFNEYTQAPAYSPIPLVIPSYWGHAVDGSSSSEPISATDSHTSDSSENSLSRSSSFFEFDLTTPDGSPCFGPSGSSSGSSQTSSNPSSPVNHRNGLIVSSAEIELQQSANYLFVDSREYYDFLAGSGGLKSDGPPQYDLDLTSDTMSLVSNPSLGPINHFAA